MLWSLCTMLTLCDNTILPSIMYPRRPTVITWIQWIPKSPHISIPTQKLGPLLSHHHLSFKFPNMRWHRNAPPLFAIPPVHPRPLQRNSPYCSFSGLDGSHVESSRHLYPLSNQCVRPLAGIHSVWLRRGTLSILHTAPMGRWCPFLGQYVLYSRH